MIFLLIWRSMTSSWMPSSMISWDGNSSILIHRFSSWSYFVQIPQEAMVSFHHLWEPKIYLKWSHWFPWQAFEIRPPGKVNSPWGSESSVFWCVFILPLLMNAFRSEIYCNRSRQSAGAHEWGKWQRRLRNIGFLIAEVHIILLLWREV